MPRGYLPGYYPSKWFGQSQRGKNIDHKYHGGKGPYYIAEWYPGWLIAGSPPRAATPMRIAGKLEPFCRPYIHQPVYVSRRNYARFMNGANMSKRDPYSPKLNYDYDAPLDEAGIPQPVL